MYGHIDGLVISGAAQMETLSSTPLYLLLLLILFLKGVYLLG